MQDKILDMVFLGEILLIFFKLNKFIIFKWKIPCRFDMHM